MHKVRKAVIPAAGFGTRLFPATQAIKKAFFPIVDRDGRAKPAILIIVEEAVRAGIEAIGIVVQEDDRARFENFFHARPSYYDKLSTENRVYSDYLQSLGARISILTQEAQDGFGHAVFCARHWIDQDPFLLLLGDHLYASDTDTPCARQILEIYEQAGKSAIAVEATPAAAIRHRGCIAGTWQDANPWLTVSQIVEKPDVDYALKHFHVAGMAADQLLAVFGSYVLTAQIFEYLEDNIHHNRREGGEFQLTSCLDRLQRDVGMVASPIQGRCFDIGLPAAYRQTAIAFSDNSHGATRDNRLW